MKPLLIGLLSLAATRMVGADPPAGVLMIVVDDLKPALGCYGDDLAITPNIDRLAARGTVFLNAHCQQAVCGPSRASALTGLRPDTLGITRFGINMREARPGLVTLPELFKAHGFTTIGLGKIFDGRNSDGWVTQDRASWTRRIDLLPFLGHLVFDYGEAKTKALITATLPTAREGGYLNDRERIMKEAGAKPSTERLDVADTFYEDGIMAREAASELQALTGAKRPFFLAVGFKKPHLPFAVPERYWTMHEGAGNSAETTTSLPGGSPSFAGHALGELRAYTDIPDEGPIPGAAQRRLIHGYHAAVSYIDAQIGILMDALDRAGALESTIIVLWGDHGFHLGDHGLFGKHTNYEQATRVPLIVAGPGVPVSRLDQPVELIDLLPALAALAGIEPPQGVDGTNILERDALKPVAASQFPRKTADGRELMGYAFRDRTCRYVAWMDLATKEVVAEEFFDYGTDPEESRNLLNDPSARADLDRLRRLAGEARPDLFR